MSLISKLVQALIAGNLTEAKLLFQQEMANRVAQKLQEEREVLGQALREGDVLKRGRTVLIRRRIRKGQVQRNIRRSAIKGFTLKGGRLTRIPASRRIKMKLKARKAARKRQAKMQTILRKRKFSLRKRKAMGIR